MVSEPVLNRGSIVVRYRRWNRDRAIEWAMSQQPRNDTDTGGGAVVQPVIHEVSGGTSFPTLTKTNYSDWAALMKVKLKARSPGHADPHDDMMALDVLASAVPPEMVSTIANKERRRRHGTPSKPCASATNA